MIYILKYIQEIDNRILKFIHKRFTNKFLDKVMPFVTACGDMGTIWIVIGTLLIIRKNYRHNGLMIFYALILVSIIGEGIIKNIVKRERPEHYIKGKELLIVEQRTYSFPSAHTASSFAVATTLLGVNIYVSGIIILIAILISFSRLYLYVHYPSDVLGGIILGISCGLIITKLF